MKKVLVVLLTIVMLFATTAVNVFADNSELELDAMFELPAIGDYNVALTDGTFQAMEKLTNGFYQLKDFENTTGVQYSKYGHVPFVNGLVIRDRFGGKAPFCCIKAKDGITHELVECNEKLIFANEDKSFEGNYDLYFNACTKTLYITYNTTAIVLPLGNGAAGWKVNYNDGAKEAVEAINGQVYILSNGRPVTIEIVPEKNHIVVGDPYTFTPDGTNFDATKLQKAVPNYGVQIFRPVDTFKQGTLTEDGLWKVVTKLEAGERFSVYNFGACRLEEMNLAEGAEHVKDVVCGCVKYFEADAAGIYTITIDPKTGLVDVDYEHNHTWKFEADNMKGVITATCIGEGCTDPVAKYALTLNVPKDAVYTGEGYEATLGEGEAENWEEYVGEVPTIRYFQVVGNHLGGYIPLKEGELPTHAGKYAAVISVGCGCNSATVAKEFVIAKSEPSLPKVIDSFTYDGKCHKLIEELAGCDLVFYSMTGLPGSYVAGPIALETFVGCHAGVYNIYYFGVDGIDHVGLKPGVLTVTISPIELTGTWSNLSYEYDGNAHTPNFELEGVLPQDQCWVKPIIHMDREAIEQGIYHATVCATVCPFGNYVFKPQTTLFYIFDHKVVNGRITTGTMNRTTNPGIAGIIPTEITEDEFINKIVKPAKDTDRDYEAKQELLKGLEDGKSMHIFTKFLDVEELAKAMFEKDYNLTDKNSVLFDARLFASLDGENKLYELYDTCDYDVTLTLVLTEDEASKLMGDNKTYYLLRYADGKVEELAVSAPVKNVDEDGNVTYSFTFKTNKFGSFALASRDKGGSPDTGAPSPLLPIYAVIFALIAGLYIGVGKKESK